MTRHACTKHEPGSAACYSRHACRCDDCRASAVRARKRSDAGLSGFVDAAPVRAHIKRLLHTGWTPHAIATAAGLASAAHVIYILNHAKRTRSSVAARVCTLRGHTSGITNSAGMVRRIHALVAVGWSTRDMSDRLGLSRTAVHHWTDRKIATPSTAARVRALYDEMWDQQPHADTPERRRTIARMRTIARRNGWPPPLAWDDGYGPHGIDNPDATPYPWRQDGRPGRGIPAEDLIEAIETGAGLAEVCERFAIKPRSIERALHRHGRGDLATRLHTWKEVA